MDDIVDRVEQSRARLAGLTDKPAAEHLKTYEELHELLDGALATLDDR